MTGESYAPEPPPTSLGEMKVWHAPLPAPRIRAARRRTSSSALLREGDIVPGNSHFDTTKGHIEYRRCHAVDCTIDAAADTQLEIPFKGEMDTAKLERCCARIPARRFRASC